MSTNNFVHLHVSSEFSIIQGLIGVDEIVDYAKEDNMQAVALTDIQNTYAAVKFFQKAIKSSVKPIIGVQIRMINDHEVVDKSTDGKHKGHGKNNIQSRSGSASGSRFDLLLYCKDSTGYFNLANLLTRSYQDGYYKGQAHIYRSWLNSENCKGLIAIEPGHLGFCASENVQNIEDIKQWFNLFPESYYFGLHRIDSERARIWEMQLMSLANKEPLPIVALNAVCFAKESDHLAHEVRVCIQEGKVLDARDGDAHSPSQFFKSQQSMCKLFADMPNAIENTVEISKRCNLKIRLGEVFLPNFPTPKGIDLAGHLLNLSQKGLESRFKRNLEIQNILQQQNDVHKKDLKKNEGEQKIDKSIYQQRLKVELDIIEKMGFAGYFLIVADFIQWAKSNSVPVGPGRGSGAGSLVAYALGITDIDPLPYGLLFERFLNPERVSMPDFDVDFCMLGRDRVIEYVGNNYGKDSVAQIITHGTMAAKAVVRDVGRVLAHPYGFVDKLAKLIPNDLGITLQKALVQSPELAAKYQEEADVKDLLDMALILEGTVRNVGRHAGGVVISPGKLTDFCPLYIEQGASHQVTQFDMGDVEKAGLVKFDFLGLRTLTIIAQAVEMLDSSGVAKGVDISAISLKDTKTFKLLQSCNTVAVFQLESRGFQELIGRLVPDCFEDIVALVALYRPGPLQSGMVDDFIDRKHGRAKVEYLHPCMSTILKETYGVIVYQEQVMQIAQKMAGYSLGDADLLRRAMGKKKPEEMAKQRSIFLKGSAKNGVDEDLSGQVFDLMEMFAGYGFNKSHSVAYAMISYQTAYLKAHYMDYFMAAVLSSDMDNTDKVVHYIEDCIKNNIEVLPPCINNSQASFVVEERGKIRHALGAIKGVGEGMALQIVGARGKSGFKDLLSLCVDLDHAKLNKKVLEALIYSGALDDLGVERGILLASIETVIAQKDQYCKNQKIGQGDLFAEIGGGIPKCRYAQKALPNWRVLQKLSCEKAVLGRYFSGHPLDSYKEEIFQLKTLPVTKISSKIRGNVLISGMISKEKRMSTKQGRLFSLVTILDFSGSFEIACFDDKMAMLQQSMQEHMVVLIEGKVSKGRNEGEVRFSPSVIKSLAKVREDKKPKVGIRIKESDYNSNLGDDILGILQKVKRGESRVFVYYYQKDNSRYCLSLPEGSRVSVDDEGLDLLRDLPGVNSVFLEYD